MNFIIKNFNELLPAELYEVLKLRNEVFVVEQNCAYLDTDDKDQKATHLLMLDNKTLAGYARILAPGISYPEPSIGRVVVSQHYRNTGAGKLLMNRCLEEAKTLYRHQDIVISAQAYLIKFYTELGFKSEGLEYMEDNIPHIRMRYAAINKS